MAISFCYREKWRLIYFPSPLVVGEAFCKIVKKPDEKESKRRKTWRRRVPIIRGKPIQTRIDANG